MRVFIEGLHAVALRLLGGLGILMALGVLSTIPRGMANGRHVGFSIVFAGICAFLCVAILVPRLTPEWLRRPATPGEGLNTVLALVLALFFVFGPMAGVVVAGYEVAEALLDRYLAAVLLPSVGLSLVLAITGVILANWPAPGDGAGQDTDLSATV